MNNVYFYFHAGSANHGCEAIVRSTQAMLNVRPILFQAVRNKIGTMVWMRFAKSKEKSGIGCLLPKSRLRRYVKASKK